ncbi:hypothetical protein GCM10022198_19410 [Klugiella xanthotipulae]|uniref:DNA helicase n=1 Tax=Klugiella xanthotipulae TaxID=244735 RepID=A0A543I6U9_9MICO|nr:DNA/RNA helicase [Klugiella xanthotipulae]TQM66324.1 hypothetical protein FB466_1163 [Klugiella xanthotipulae]
MSLSRKRKRELKKLKSYAEDVLHDQKIVLDRAKDVLLEAGVQAKHLSDEYVAPRVNDACENVRPTVERGIRSAKQAANSVRRTAAPAVTAALITAVNALDAADNPGARRASESIVRLGTKTGFPVKQQKKKKRSAGGVIALILGAVAAVGVAAALWQTFRADDELWIAAEDAE